MSKGAVGARTPAPAPPVAPAARPEGPADQSPQPPVPAGKPVGAASPPVATVTITSTAGALPATPADVLPTAAPAEAAPPVSAPADPSSAPDSGGTVSPESAPMQEVLAGKPTVPGPVTWPAVGSGMITGYACDCCGPLGAHGPIGQEIYFRTGFTAPYGNGLLARNLSTGWSVQGGGRSQFFEPDGAAAWAIDLHVTYTRNEAKGDDIFTVQGEPVSLRELHRTALGLGLGRDHFLARPGYLLGTWDANFRFGWDVGGRWGAGHVDLDPVLEEAGYRRRYDVFGQAFFGLIGTMEIPVGGWTYLIGGRLEVDYTLSDLLPRQSNFYDGYALFTVGVRY